MSLFDKQSEECLERVTANNFTQPEISQGNRIFGLLWAVTLWSYYWFFILWYAIRRRSSPYLKKRLFGFVVISTIQFSFEETWALREFFGRENYPCIFFQPAVLWTLGFGLLPIMIRVFLFWRRVEYNKMAAKDGYYQDVRENYNGIYGAMAKAETANRKKKKRRNSKEDMKFSKLGAAESVASRFQSLQDAGDERLRRSLVPVEVIALASGSGPSEESLTAQTVKIPNVLTQSQHLHDSRRVRKLKIYKFISSPRFGWIIFVVSTIITICLTYSVVQDVYDCYGCEDLASRGDEFLISGGLFFICLVGTIYILYQIRLEPDPLDRRSELVQSMKVALPFIVLWMIVDAPDIGGLYKKGRIYWGYFLQFAFACGFFVMVPLQIRKSYALDGLDGETKELADQFEEDMKSTTRRRQFRRFLVVEQSLETFYFWAEIKQWSEDYPKLTKAERKERFKFIYDVFISHRTLLRINVGGYMKEDLQDVVDKLGDEDFDVPENVYNEALSDVFRMMIFGPYMSFIRSRLYNEEH